MPFLGITAAGSDPCTLQLPAHSLRTGTRYQFQLNAFLKTDFLYPENLVYRNAIPVSVKCIP